MTAGINYTPASFATNHNVTAAEWATEITNPFIGLQAAWDTYTPVLTAATTNPTLGSGSVTNGWYIQIGKTVFGGGRVGFGTSGVVVGSGRYTISLPPVAANTSVGLVAGTGILQDASGPTTFVIVPRLATSTTFYMYLDNQTTATLGCSSALPVVPAASDTYDYLLCYQAA